MTDSVTVRRQKIRKNHTRKRFVFFLLTTAVFLIVVCFARQFCPYDPNAQVFSALEPPSPCSIRPERIASAGICCPVF